MQICLYLFVILVFLWDKTQILFKSRFSVWAFYSNCTQPDSSLKHTPTPCCVCRLCLCSHSYVTSVVSPGLMFLSHWVFQTTLKFTFSPLIRYRCFISLLPSLTWIQKVIFY